MITLDSIYLYIPLIVQTACLIFKMAIFGALLVKKTMSKKKRPLLFLALILITSMYESILYIFYCLSRTPFTIGSKNVVVLFTQIYFVVVALHFIGILLFFNELSSKKYSLKYFFINIPIIAGFFCASIYRVTNAFISSRSTYIPSDYTMGLLVNIYYLSLIFLSLILLCKNYRTEKVKLMREHIFTLGMYFMLPYSFLRVFDSVFFSRQANLITVSLLSASLSLMLFYCLKKLVRTRFLNIKTRTQSSYTNFNFPRDFIETISILGRASKLEHLPNITKQFFKQAFFIDEKKIFFILRNSPINNNEDLAKQLCVEQVSSSDDMMKFLEEEKLFIRDELEFTHFHEKQSNCELLKRTISFLDEINADIFLPIYSENKLTAAIIISHNSRPKKPFTNVEADEMLIYCNYISGIIYLLTHANVNALLDEAHLSKAKAYRSEKKLALIQKSISSFIENQSTKKVGVLTYKNKKFTYINKDADILGVDLNKDKGLDITKQITEIAEMTSTFLTPNKKLVLDSNDDYLVVTTSPNLEKNNTVITVYKPNLSDLTSDKLTSLKDPAKWEFVLALHSTEDGKTIERLLPADTPTLLNCKVNFFEKATTRKSILLEINEDQDALSFAHVIHKINKRSIFEEVEARNPNIINALFGEHPIYRKEPGLIEKLNGKGTLFIQNVHLLDLDCQRKLLELMRTGRFTSFHNNESISADIIIICSTVHNLLDLVQRGFFLKELYLELRESSVWLPIINTLPEEEFRALAEGLRKQLVYSKAYKNLLSFNSSDIKKLLSKGCSSLHELKSKVKHMVVSKTQSKSLDTIIDPAYQVPDIELAEAARLGKNALKDPKILGLLLQKFKGSQSKVASFLNVNRSSVSRRCDQFGLKFNKDS